MWEDCLIGQFFGSLPSFSQVQDVARQLWGRRDRVDVLKLDSGFFLFRFENPHTKAWVLDSGPWFVTQQPLLLKKWVPGITLEKFLLPESPYESISRGSLWNNSQMKRSAILQVVWGFLCLWIKPLSLEIGCLLLVFVLR